MLSVKTDNDDDDDGGVFVQSTLDSRGRPIVELPPKEVEIVRLPFSPVEREFYEALEQRSKVHASF